MEYTIDYFIEKFEAISGEKWGAGDLFSPHGQKCWAGHCGITPSDNFIAKAEELPEIVELAKMLKEIGVVPYSEGVWGKGGYLIAVNDTMGKMYFDLPTPKERCMAALYKIKEVQNEERKQMQDV